MKSFSLFICFLYGILFKSGYFDLLELNCKILTLETFSCLQGPVETKPITNDDVLGDPIPYDQQDAMRHVCYQLFDLTPTVCNPLYPFFN